MSKLKNILSILISLIVLIALFLNFDFITDKLKFLFNATPELVILPGNDYTKDYEYKFVKQVDDYIPKNYDDLINIFYSSLNMGWDSFIFYCPVEYESCLDDVTKISLDEVLLSDINNFVHPYNSFKTISFAYTNKGDFSLSIEHVYSKEEIAEINYIVSNKIKDLITDSMTTRDKIKTIHDYIINNTDYDELKTKNINDETYKSNTAYGVLIQGYGICSGYADTMAIFLNELDIENYKISNETHIWNLVYINGVWKHLDATWDDPISEFNANRDTYFLISYDELTKLNDDTHSFDKSVYKEAY